MDTSFLEELVPVVESKFHVVARDHRVELDHLLADWPQPQVRVWRPGSSLEAILGVANHSWAQPTQLALECRVAARVAVLVAELSVEVSPPDARAGGLLSDTNNRALVLEPLHYS